MTMIRPMRSSSLSGEEEKIQKCLIAMRCFTRWVCEDHPELQMVVGNLLHSYDRDEYESMAKVVDAYNKAVRDTSVQYGAWCKSGWTLCQVKDLLEDKAGKEKVMGRRGQRPTRSMLKHIIQQVRDASFSNPTLKFKRFTTTASATRTP